MEGLGFPGAHLLDVLICSSHFPNSYSDWCGQAVTHQVVDLGGHCGGEQQGLSVWSDLPHNASHLGTDRHTDACTSTCMSHDNAGECMLCKA